MGENYAEYSSVIDGFLTLPSSASMVKVDIESFYDSIDQDALMIKLGSILSRDIDILQLLDKLLRYEVLTTEGTTVDGRGLPIGPAYAHHFANFYLSEIDSNWAPQTLGYARYVDDVVMILPSTKDVRESIEGYERAIGTLGLHLNSQKTRVASVAEPNHVVDEVKKQKYRIGVIAHQDGDEEQITEQIRSLFRTSFWDLEDISQMSQITSHVRFLVFD